MKKDIFCYEKIAKIIDRRFFHINNQIVSGLLSELDKQEVHYDLNPKHSFSNSKLEILRRGGNFFEFSLKNLSVYFDARNEDLDLLKDLIKLICNIDKLNIYNRTDRTKFINIFIKNIDVVNNRTIFVDLKKIDHSIVVVPYFSRESNTAKIWLMISKNSKPVYSSKLPSIVMFYEQKLPDNSANIVNFELYNVSEKEFNNYIINSSSEVPHSEKIERNTELVDPLNGDLSEKEIPLKYHSMFKYDYEKNEILVFGNSMDILLNNVKDIKNIDFLNLIDKRKIKGKFVLEYQSLGSTEISIFKISNKLKTFSKIDYSVEKNEVLPSFYKKDLSGKETYYFVTENKGYLDLTTNFDEILSKISGKFKSGGDLFKFILLFDKYKRDCNACN